MSEVIGFHAIICSYGFWLPNEQRGSQSDFVRNENLLKYGPANPVGGNRSVAKCSFDPEIRRMARDELMYPYVEFGGEQALSIAKGFRNEITQYGGAIHALAILPSHTHIVLPPARYDIRRFIGRLKGAATKQLIADGLHPLTGYRDSRGNIPSPWARLPWVVYLFGHADVHRSVDYAEGNPLKACKPKQRWHFVTPFPFPE